MAKTYEPIAKQTLASAVASVTFSSISQAYTDLIFVTDFAPNETAPFKLYVGNGSLDTATNYSNTELRADGTTVATGKVGNQGFFNAGYVGSASKCMHIINFQNYSNTTTPKTVLIRFSTAADLSYSVLALSGLWRGASNAAINTIQISTNQSPQVFAIGSTFTLYGIKVA